MRRRRFRGVVSRGELCSLHELGLSSVDTDEVAVLTCSVGVGTPIAEVIQRAHAYDELWSVFQKPTGFNEYELQSLHQLQS